MFNRILKVFLKPLVIGVVSGAALFLVFARTSQTASPRIVIAKQANCPLQLLSTGVDSSNPLAPHYWYSVTNTSDKPISAYAIQQQISLAPSAPTTGTSLVHFRSESLLLRPAASRVDDGGIGSAYPKPPVEITLIVDFVEFADGSRWGDDTSRSGDRLDGKRAGGQSAIKRYREILNQRGLQALELALTDAAPVTPEGENLSAEWYDGFATGVSVVKHRLIKAKQKRGLEAMKSELEKPFDSKDGRREP